MAGMAARFQILYFQLINLAHQNRTVMPQKRFVYRCLLYATKIHYQFREQRELDYKLLSEVVSLKSDDIACIYTHFEGESIEKDQVLCHLFNRELFQLFEKFKLIKLMSTILKDLLNIEKLKALLKKLMKLTVRASLQGEQVNKFINMLFCICLNDNLIVLQKLLGP